MARLQNLVTLYKARGAAGASAVRRQPTCRTAPTLRDESLFWRPPRRMPAVYRYGVRALNCGRPSWRRERSFGPLRARSRDHVTGEGFTFQILAA
jgi:hypothetical protein